MTTRQIPLFQAIANELDRMHRITTNPPSYWEAQHKACIVQSVKTNLERLEGLLPSGSGIDCGTKIEPTDGRKIVLIVEFHHMDEGGGYDGWTSHKLTVSPSLAYGFDIRIDGRDRNGIKEYLGEVYKSALRELVDPYPERA